MRIVFVDDYADAMQGLVGLSRLAGHDVTVHADAVKDPAVLLERLADAEVAVLIQQRTPLSRAMIERLPKLRLIAQTGRNVAHLDVAACSAAGILISARAGGSGVPTAELAWGLILTAIRDIPYQMDRLKSGAWLDGMGTTLAGNTLGVYAFGRIGSHVAAYGRVFGMRVLCFGREGSLERAATAGFEVTTDRRAFFESIDVLSLHIPLNRETTGLVTAEDLARMKTTALLVNTSRAGIIAKGALYAALVAGRPGRAAVDVFDDEPVLGDDPLLGLPNAWCTPHLGYSVREVYAEILDAVIDQILAFAAGGPIDVVNPEALAARKS